MNLLSLDVVIGSVISALFFGKLLEVKILPYGLAALALTVWIIYTADHLRDAKKVKGDASSDRHRFHQRHFKTLSVFLVGAVLADAVLIFFIRKPVFIGGIVLSILVAIYLIFQSRLFFLKELMVALLYTLGVLLPSVAVSSLEISLVHYELMMQFFVIALLNLIIFSFFDFETDVRDGLSSFATHFGKKFTRQVIVIAFAIWLFVWVHVFLQGDFTAYNFVLLFSAVPLLLIFLFPDFFVRHGLYRLVGEAVFYTPALIFLT